MEEEVTQRTIALSIRTAKLTGSVLRAALRKFLAAQHQKGKNPYKQGKQTVEVFFASTFWRKGGADIILDLT